MAGSNQVSSSAAKKELDALSKMLDFQVIYKTFPQTKGPSSDLVTLVTLKTKPPKVSIKLFGLTHAQKPNVKSQKCAVV